MDISGGRIATGQVGWNADELNKIMRKLLFVFSQKLEYSTIITDYLTETNNKLLQLQI